MMYPLIAFTLSKIVEVERSPTKPSSAERHEDDSTVFSLKKLFSVPRFTFGLISQVIVYAAVTYLQPTLALHLE